MSYQNNSTDQNEKQPSRAAMEAAEIQHWGDLSQVALYQYYLTTNQMKPPPALPAGCIADRYLAECLLSHLKAEFHDIEWPESWDQLKDQDIPKEMIAKLHFVARRRTFKGVCEICREWDCPEAVVTQEPLTVDKAIEAFAAELKARERTGKTRKNYLPFLQRSLKKYNLVPTDPKIIRQLLASYNNRNTRHTYRLYLSTFYSFLEAEHDIPNPMTKVRSPGTDKTLPRHLNPEEKRQLQEVSLSPRDKAIVKLFLETAVRPDEVIGTRGHPLRFCDIYEDHIEVSGKVGERMVPALPELRDMLLSLQNGRSADSPVFMGDRGHPLTTWGLSKVIRRAFRAAGISNASPYTLRHSFAGEFLANGGDVATLQKILGHRDIKTTMIYTHIADKAMVDVYRRNVRGANNPL